MNDIERGGPAFALNIKKLCEERKMTHRELAQKSGITSVSVSRYCSGARVPSATTLYAMAKALDCRMDELMEGVEQPGEEDGEDAPEAVQESV